MPFLPSRLQFLQFTTIFLIISCDDSEPLATADRDTTTPTIRIVSPKNGDFLGEFVTIIAAAQDYDDILSVDFYIDDVLVHSDSTPPFEYNWNTRSHDEGEHSIHLVARDISNNTARSTNRITVTAIDPSKRKIVFTSYRADAQDIYNNIQDIFIMNIDGSNQINLRTDAQAEIAFPKFSPDGTMILYYQSTYSDLYIMDTAGITKTNLTNSLAGEIYPNFSPDGARIVYMYSEYGPYEIDLMDLDGGNKVTLAYPDSGEHFYSPTFSPDGSKVTFYSSDLHGNGDIYAIDVDGNNQINLTADVSGQAKNPRFSPDGTKIVFYLVGDENEDIYTVNIDGSSLTNLTNSTGNDRNPQFSLDGMKILFTTDRNLGYKIYLMDSDGSDPIELTFHHAEANMYPDISSDGTQIVFFSFDAVYIMGMDGSNLINLTNPDRSERNKYPVLQPLQ